MAKEEIDARRTALLVMDLQNGIVGRFGNQAEALLTPLGRAIAAARDAGVGVIFVRVAFREGAPEASARNRSFATLAEAGGFGTDDEATQIHPAIEPAAGEAVVVKKRVSAFTGSDLEVLLRSREIDTLILTGIATSGVVLSTLREAADSDYRLLVLSDCCRDGDPEVHGVLIEKVFPRQAEVLTVDALLSRLSSAG